MYFRDVYDHLVRLHDLVEGLRDLVGGPLDTYLSVVSNRVNEVIKTLTVITTVFMPLVFITGFFGMNFFQAGAGLQDWTEPRVMLLALAGHAAAAGLDAAVDAPTGWLWSSLSGIDG